MKRQEERKEKRAHFCSPERAWGFLVSLRGRPAETLTGKKREKG